MLQKLLQNLFHKYWSTYYIDCSVCKPFRPKSILSVKLHPSTGFLVLLLALLHQASHMPLSRERLYSIWHSRPKVANFDHAKLYRSWLIWHLDQITSI